MYPVATDLSHGDKLPSSDDIARYCKPTAYDVSEDTPLVGAFLRRPNEPDLSVDRLQAYQEADRLTAIGLIREAVGDQYELRPNGRFVVLHVANVQSVAQQEGCDVGIIYTPKPSQPSHSSIGDLPITLEEEFKIATAFLRLASPVNTYPAVL